jgi:hypothetical protein
MHLIALSSTTPTLRTLDPAVSLHAYFPAMRINFDPFDSQPLLLWQLPGHAHRFSSRVSSASRTPVQAIPLPFIHHQICN